MTRAWLAAAVALAGCADYLEDAGPWEPAAAITGDLAPELGPPPPGALATPATVRVASWNVHLAEDPAGLAAAYLASPALARADVLLVQEIEAHPDEPASRAGRLAEALGMTWVYAPARVEGTGTHGLAILSRFPLEDVEIRRLPRFENPINQRERNALRVTVVAGERRLQLACLHLDVRLPPADRVRQLHAVVDELAPQTIIGGDFNTNPWAWFEGTVPLAASEAILGMEQARVIDDYLASQELAGVLSPDVATMPLPAFQMRIDNIYARDLALGAFAVEPVEGSDHWPFWVDLELQESGLAPSACGCGARR